MWLFLYLRVKAQQYLFNSICMFLDKETWLKIWLNLTLKVTIFRGAGPWLLTMHFSRFTVVDKSMHQAARDGGRFYHSKRMRMALSSSRWPKIRRRRLRVKPWLAAPGCSIVPWHSSLSNTVEPLGTDTSLLQTVSNVQTKFSYFL